MNCKRDLLNWKAAIALLALPVTLMVAGCSDPQADLGPIDRARAALTIGDGLQAEVVLRDAMAAGTDRAALAAYLGEAELQQGQLAEAREWLGKEEFSEDTRSHGFHMLARLEMEEGNLPAAGQAFDKALAINRENAALWVDIARLRYRGGEQAQAIEASEYAVELDPENPQVLQLRAQFIRDSEGMMAALPWFERALAISPDNTDLMYDYAATLGELGRAKDMLAVVREIAKIQIGNRRIYYLQAVLAARAKKYELARLLLQRSDKVTQERPAAMLLSGVIDIENGNYASAAQTLERLSAKQPDNQRVRLMLARALALGRNDSELIYLFSDEARRDGASPYLLTLVGRAHEALDEREKAAYFLDKAAQTRTGNLIAMPAGIDLDVAEARGSQNGDDALQLMRARITGNVGGGAVAAVKPLLERFPGSADVLSLSGDAAFAGRKFGLANQRYGQAAMIRQPWTLARKRIKALQAADRPNDALILLATYFTGDPANIEASSELGKAAMTDDDFNSAAIFFDHALTNGGARDPVLLTLRAQVALEAGDLFLAIEAAEMAYQLQPMNRKVTAVLARVYREYGEHEEHAALLDAKLKQLPK